MQAQMSYYNDRNELVKIDGYYKSGSGFNYSNLYALEHLFYDRQFVKTLQLIVENNRHFATYFSIFYIVGIFALKKYMKTRERFSLRGLLIAWNLFLAIFSICGTVRIWPEFIYVLKEHGLQYSMCEREFLYGVGGHWGFWFCFSKFFELIDTVFIVLRKQPLIFLHYYHHATILFYT